MFLKLIVDNDVDVANDGLITIEKFKNKKTLKKRH